jgi:hypothetical protein
MSHIFDKANVEITSVSFENVIWGSRPIGIRAHVLWGSNTERKHVLWGSNTRGSRPTGKPIRK